MVRPLPIHAHSVSLLPQPPLPQVPGPGARTLAPAAHAPNCCPPSTSTWSSLSPSPSPPSPSTTKKPSTTSSSAPLAETLLTIAGDPERLGVEIGFFAVLHTWGQNLHFHPHLHCVVPGGGPPLPPNERWIAAAADSCCPSGPQPLLPPSVPGGSGKGSCRRRTAVLRRPRTAARTRPPLPAIWLPSSTSEWVVYAKPPLADRHTCWSISAATRIAWPSPIAACWHCENAIKTRNTFADSFGSSILSDIEGSPYLYALYSY